MDRQKEAPGGGPGTSDAATKCNQVIHQSGAEVKPENIPEALKEPPRWVAWRSENRDGRPTKVPYKAATRTRADATDPATWSSFGDTSHFVATQRAYFAGLGFVLGDGFAGVDLDDCLDADGQLHPAAAEVVATLDSYTEVSPSGRGLKVFLKADLGDRDGHRTKAVPWGGEAEVYWSNRYFTVTGRHWPGTPTTVEDRQTALADLHARFLGREDTPPAVPTPSALPTADVADLLEVAFRAANGAKLKALFNEPGRDGGSEGDAALCGHLAFYSGGDAGLLERLMRASQRVRPKWDSKRGGETWIGSECRKAVERHSGDWYTPGRPAVTATSTEEQVHRPVTSAAAKLLAFNRTDAGNGEALAFLFGERLRFDWKRERWLRWSHHLWAPATVGDLTILAKKAARERYAAAGQADDLEGRKWAFGSESKARVEAALSFARAEPPITDSGDGWDGDPMLLGCPNGVVELATGTFRPGRPEDKVTLQVGTPYDPQAECPRWQQFLEEVFGDDDLISFVWRACGYSLTGSTREQVFFLLHGRGSNGKSLFLSVLRHVLGDYAHNVAFSLFDFASRLEHSQNLAQLEHRRFVTASESAENCRLNEDRLKALAGSDPITARLMRENDRTFDNTAKVWLGVNHRPRVLDDSDGFWRKARLVPFTRRFVDPDKLAADPSLSLDPQVLPADRDLEATLKAEAPGILRWAVQGAALWACDGLREPEVVRAASQSWREEADPLGDFFATRCVFGDACKVRAGDLYAAYCEHCDEQGMKDKERMSQTAFGRRIVARFDKKRSFLDGKVGPVYYGIGLADNRPTL